MAHLSSCIIDFIKLIAKKQALHFITFPNLFKHDPLFINEVLVLKPWLLH